MKKLMLCLVAIVTFSVCASLWASEAVQERDRNYEVRGWHVQATDDNIGYVYELITELDTTYAQLAAEDYVTAQSSGTDTTQTLTIKGIDTTGKKRSLAIELNGTSVVYGGVQLRYVDQVDLDKECAGTVSLKRATGATLVTSIPIGQLNAEMAQHFNGEKDGYVTGWRPAVTSTDADTIRFQLRWYPDDADSLDDTDGFVVIDEAEVEDELAIYDLSFGQPVRCPAGGWLGAFAMGVGASAADVAVVIQGYDVNPN